MQAIGLWRDLWCTCVQVKYGGDREKYGGDREKYGGGWQVTLGSSRATGVKKRTDPGDAAGVATKAAEAEATGGEFLSACDVMVVPD